MKNTFTAYHIRDLDKVAFGKCKNEMARHTSTAQHSMSKRESGRRGLRMEGRRKKEKRRVEETNTTDKIIPILELKAIQITETNYPGELQVPEAFGRNVNLYSIKQYEDKTREDAKGDNLAPTRLKNETKQMGTFIYQIGLKWKISLQQPQKL